MLYMRCPTCGELLGNKELIYIERMKKICTELGVDDDIVSIGQIDKDEKFIKKKQEIIKDLCENICCRPRLMTYIDLVQVIRE